MIGKLQLGKCIFSAGCVLALATLVAGCSPQTVVTTSRRQAYMDAHARLLAAADAKEEFIRTKAIEGLARTVGQDAGDVYLDALDDQSPAVRFAAALAIGDTGYALAMPRLQKMAADKSVEPDRRVFTGVIYALYSLGDDSYMNRLLDLLLDDPEPEVRANAAMVMGRVGEPSAIKPLKTLMSDEQAMVTIQAIQSLAMLGDPAGVSLMEAYAKQPFIDQRLVVLDGMAQVPARRILTLLKQFNVPSQPPRVRVVAAQSLARLTAVEDETYMYTRRCVVEPRAVLIEAYGGESDVSADEVVSLTSLASMAIGHMNRPEALDVIYPKLQSGEKQVQVAAAIGILTLLDDYSPPAPQTPEATGVETQAQTPVPEDVASPRPESQPASAPAVDNEDVLSRPRLHWSGAKE